MTGKSDSSAAVSFHFVEGNVVPFVLICLSPVYLNETLCADFPSHDTSTHPLIPPFRLIRGK